MPRATRCGLRIRTGLPRRRTDRRSGTGPTRSCGSPARSGPYNFEFMDQVHREIVTKYKVDGIFTNRWAPQAECHCVHCQRNFKAATGLELPQSTEAADPARRAFIEWRKARLTELWKAWDATIRARQSRGAADPERSARPQDRERARGDPVHRLPGPPRRHAAVGQRPARQGIPRGDGPAAGRRHLQRRSRGGVSLEGFGAERAGDAAVGRRGHRQRHAAVVHEVLGHALRSPLAAGGRADLRLARAARALPAQRAAARARRAAALGADRGACIRAWRQAIDPPTTCSACITRWSRRGCRSRWSTRRS